MCSWEMLYVKIIKSNINCNDDLITFWHIQCYKSLSGIKSIKHVVAAWKCKACCRCVKSVQRRSFFWSEYRKIRTSKISVSGHFSRSVQFSQECRPKIIFGIRKESRYLKVCRFYLNFTHNRRRRAIISNLQPV